MSVCLSVWCMSRSCIVSKRVNTFSNLFHHRIAMHTILNFLYQTLWHYSDMEGAGCRIQVGCENSRFSTNISLWHNRWTREYQVLSTNYDCSVSTKRRTMFIAADGHAKICNVSVNLHMICVVVRSKYVDNSKRRPRQSVDGQGEDNRTEFTCTHW